MGCPLDPLDSRAWAGAMAGKCSSFMICGTSGLAAGGVDGSVVELKGLARPAANSRGRSVKVFQAIFT